MVCEIYKTVKHVGISYTYIRKVIQYTLSYLHEEGNVSVHLIGDMKMKTLNRQYRGQDNTTDVLSFAQHDGMCMPIDIDDELGDIFISIPRIRVQAREYEVSFKEEFSRMLVHAILHVLGYDHIMKKDAEKMFALQEKIVSKII